MIVFVLFNYAPAFAMRLIGLLFLLFIFQGILGKKIPLDIKKALHLIDTVEKLGCDPLLRELKKLKFFESSTATTASAMHGLWHPAKWTVYKCILC